MITILQRSAEMSNENANPITAICIVSDKNKCPNGFRPITKSYDDQIEADVWKDSFFSLSRIYRYIAFSREAPKNAFGLNIVADICVVGDRDPVPTGFVALEFTEDTREKALRKKLFCIRSVPRETAVDAVVDMIILSKQKRPPSGYSLAGEIDGLCVCYKYGVIPLNFGSTNDMLRSVCSSSVSTIPQLYPSIASATNMNGSVSTSTLMTDTNALQAAASNAFTIRTNRQQSKGIDGVPFELSAMLIATFEKNQVNQLPDLPIVDDARLERDYTYRFNLERTTLESI